MNATNRKMLLERDINLMNSLIAGMCIRELTEKGRSHIKKLIKAREDDISKLENVLDRSDLRS